MRWVYTTWSLAQVYFVTLRVATVARRQVFGRLDLRKHDMKNEHSQAVVFALW